MFRFISTMSLHGNEDMDQLLQDSQPPSPQNVADPPPDVDDGAGLGGGGGVSGADNVVPVPAVTTTTTATIGAFPNLQPPGPQQHLLLLRAQDGQARKDQL